MWAYAQGVDERQVEPPKSRKSVGAECNWGIRFQNDTDALAFMDSLAGELSSRMKGVSRLLVCCLLGLWLKLGKQECTSRFGK